MATPLTINRWQDRPFRGLERSSGIGGGGSTPAKTPGRSGDSSAAPVIRVARAALALLAWLFPAPDAAALDPARGLGEYSLSAWQTTEGLAHDTVQDLVQTRDGYLWVATVEGVARFDGVRFVVFDRSNSPAFARNDVQALYESRDGSLWLGLYGGGLVRYRDGEFRAYTAQEGLPSTMITAIAEDAQGHLWVGTDGRGVFQFKDGVFSGYGKRDGLAENAVGCLYVDRRGDLWIGHSSGLDRLRNNRFEHFAAGDGLAGASVTALVEDAQGSLLVGTSAGMLRVAGPRLVPDAALAGLARDYINALRLDRRGTLWIGTDRGLKRFRGGTLDTLTPADGLTDPSVMAILEDREGNLWVGTIAGGLNRLKEGTAFTYTTAHGLSSDVVESVAPARDGGLWIGSGDGEIDRFVGGRFTSLSARRVLDGAIVRALHEDRRHRVWVGTDRGLYRWEDGHWTHYTTREGLPHSVVRSIIEDREGRLWIGTDGGGISRFEDGHFETFGTVPGLASDHVRAILEDRKGRLWIASYGGLSVLANGRSTTYTTRDGLSHDLVRSLYEDGEGVLWIGTYGGGLNRLQDGRITAYTSREGLFNDVIYQILEDDRGNLWMSCNKGLFSVSKRQLADFAAGRVRSIRSLAYGRSDGMRSADFNGGSPGGWKATDGNLYFPSSKGLVVVDPSGSAVKPAAPSPIVEEAVVDGETVPVRGSLEIPPGARRLELHYTSLDLQAPERIRFSFKLEGFDTDWIDAGSRRRAHYTNVPPGDYRFRVRTGSDDGSWSDADGSVPLRVRARWYQTRAFPLALAAGAVLAAAAAHRLRVRSLVARESELARRVAEAMSSIRVLKGLLPICASCKSVRDDKGYWNRIEAYIGEHSEAEFSHGICPDCARRLYPDAYRRVEQRRQQQPSEQDASRD